MSDSRSEDGRPDQPVRDERPSCAVVIIGNEVLSGKVVEKNGAFLIGRLREIGVRLGRLEIVSDDYEAIGDAVRRASTGYDFVLTTGGVGPTHDDITIAAIARAFDVPVVRHPDIESLVRGYFGDKTTEAHLRLADVPEGAVLRGGSAPPWPTVTFRNIYILPGIPKLAVAKFEALASHFGGQKLYNAALTVHALEADIADALDGVVATHGAVEIGSYPRKEDGRWIVRLTVESVDRHATAGALEALRAAFAENVTAIELVAP